MNAFCYVDSPIGRLMLTTDGTALTGLYMNLYRNKPTKLPTLSDDWVQNATIDPLPAAARQLKEYFAGKRREFNLPLRMHGTEIERPLAIVMTGGLVTSTIFILLVLPTIYPWFTKRAIRQGGQYAQ